MLVFTSEDSFEVFVFAELVLQRHLFPAETRKEMGEILKNFQANRQKILDQISLEKRDLLSQLLDTNHETRPSATTALQHKYFKTVLQM